MNYERPILVNFSGLSNSQGACMNGSNPAYGICTCNTGASAANSQGAGCNDGCTAANHCNNGTDAGFQGKPQGCKNGAGARDVAAMDGTGCITGYGVTTTPGSNGIGGCMTGGGAMGCNSGANRILPSCVSGVTDA